jgi:hypothetical protein
MFIYSVVLKAGGGHIKKEENENPSGLIWIPGKFPKVRSKYFHSCPGIAKGSEDRLLSREGKSGSAEAPWILLPVSEASTFPVPPHRNLLSSASWHPQWRLYGYESGTEKGQQLDLELHASTKENSPIRARLPGHCQDYTIFQLWKWRFQSLLKSHLQEVTKPTF